MPDDFVGTVGECPDCRRAFRVVAGPGTTNLSADDLDPRLVVRSGPQRVGEQLVLRGELAIEIGKLAGKPIELPGNLVSRNHCKLVRTGTRWTIEDQKSTNGIFVNGRRVSTAELRAGDVLKVGEYELEYVNRVPEVEEVELEEIENVYDIAEEPTTVKLEAVPLPDVPAPLPVLPILDAGPVAGGVRCPSCGTHFAADAQICVRCGINIHTGRALILANDLDDEDAQERILKFVRVASFIDPLGLYPVASEGYGRNKPYVVWVIAALTTLVTAFVWIADIGGSRATLTFALWSGGEPSAMQIAQAYGLTDRHPEERWQGFRNRVQVLEDQMSPDKAVHTAYSELPAGDQQFGQFHWYQLITNGFLHGGLFHLAGNLLFLLVFGSRVNALIGQWKTALVYPLLLIASSAAQWVSMSGEGAQAALGASGAIMGMAGMYFVLFPVHRVFLIIWFRFTLWIFVPLWWTNVYYKMWPIRGFWVVLTYISFDVVATLLGSRDHVAHWAHLGGFIAGMVLAIGMLLARQIDANSGDLLSVLLGRRAWALIGKPAARRQRLSEAAPA